MNCDCFKKVEELMKVKTGDPFAQLIRGCTLIGKIMTSVPFVPVEYRNKKTDGALEDKATRHGLIASYCPFCGVKAFDGKEEGE
jgi:hypothetical protein